VVVPAYNEAKNLPLLLFKIDNSFKKNKINGEVVLVDDGSTDNTKEVTIELRKKYRFLKAIRHEVNRGLTNALITCFKNSTGQIIIFLPADLESNPEEDIPKLLNKLNEGYDMVCGWRQKRKGIKKISSNIYNMLSRLLFGINIHDLNWIKAFKREVIKDIRLRSDWHRYLAILAKSEGYRIGEVKVNAYKRKYGKSKFGISRLFIGIIDLLVVKFHLSFIDKPMLLLSSLGVVLLILAFFGGVYLLIIKIMTGVLGNRIPLFFLVVVLIILGIQLFALGFLAELLVTMTERINKNK